MSIYWRRTEAFELLIGRGDCESESGVNRKDNGDDGDGDDDDDDDDDEIGSDEYSISMFVTLMSRI